MARETGKWFLILELEDGELYSVPCETRAEAEESLAEVQASGYVAVEHEDHTHDLSVRWAGVAQVTREWTNED